MELCHGSSGLDWPGWKVAVGSSGFRDEKITQVVPRCFGFDWTSENAESDG